MVGFVNKLELSDQKYQTNGNLRDENYKGKFLFSMKDFVSLGTDSQSMYLMSTIFLKYNINEVCVIKFQLSYICNTNNSSHKTFVKFCHEIHYI